MFLDKLKAYGASVLAVAFLGLLLVQTYRLYTTQLELVTVREEWSGERAAAAAALAAKAAQARATEQTLQAVADQTRKEKQDEITALAAHRDALLKRLRSLQSSGTRLPGTSPATSTGTVAAGSDDTRIPAEIGEQDVEEAMRADTIRISLLACYRQYAAARKALNQ